MLVVKQTSLRRNLIHLIDSFTHIEELHGADDTNNQSDDRNLCTNELYQDISIEHFQNFIKSKYYVRMHI